MSAAAPEEFAPPAAPIDRPDFVAIQLHSRDDHCWAVVDGETGAIAEDGSARLIMRLTRDEAEKRAARMCEMHVHVRKLRFVSRFVR